MVWVGWASLTCERGLPSGKWSWPVEPQDVGGPSEVSAYECWIGCARAIGGRVGLDGETGEVFERRLSPDHHEALEWVRSLPGRRR